MDITLAIIGGLVFGIALCFAIQRIAEEERTLRECGSYDQVLRYLEKDCDRLQDELQELKNWRENLELSVKFLDAPDWLKKGLESQDHV